MSQSAKIGQPKIIQSLPVELHDRRRFLLWKELPGLVPGKTRKTPYYADGTIRKGLLDTKADLDKLVTLDEALDEFMLGGYSGIGFALANDGIGAFDLDKCLDDRGSLIKDHPGHDLVLEAKKAGAYIELSPSKHGLRIVGPCLNPEAYSKGGLEYWGAKRFVTLTGDVWANPRGWVDLDDLRTPLSAPRAERDDDDDEDGVLVTPKVLAELRSALASMDSDERDLWVRMGMSLKPIGKKGLELWLEWSAKSKKFNRADALRVWDSMDVQHAHYRSVFAESQSNWGWENPRSKPHLVSDNDDPEDSDDEDESDGPDFANGIDLGEQKLLPTEYVLDGFLPAGISVIAGAWGAGKSTNLVPLLASAAHLTPAEWGFHPTLRRHVVWISEAPEQARDTIYSLAKAEGSASWGEFKEWFHLFSARRQPIKKVARRVAKLIDELTWTTDTGFRVKPVIVLDTTTANIELENESDNTQVAAAMAVLKERMPGVPLVLVGHTPKAMVRGDVADMTFRGAGAWEAEAVATYFLVHDHETDDRFLAIRKARFTPNYREVEFDFAGGSEIIPTPWGEPQSKSYVHGVPTKSSGEARRQAKREIEQERKEERQEKVSTERQKRILDLVRSAAAAGRILSRSKLREQVGGKAELVSAALDRLVEGEMVQLVVVTREELEQVGVQWRGRVPELILPIEVNLSDFLASVRGAK